MYDSGSTSVDFTLDDNSGPTEAKKLFILLQISTGFVNSFPFSSIIFGGIGERIEIIHRAHNRDNFARGALLASTWIVRQPNGLYDMLDVLGLKERKNFSTC